MFGLYCVSVSILICFFLLIYDMGFLDKLICLFWMKYKYLWFMIWFLYFVYNVLTDLWYGFCIYEKFSGKFCWSHGDIVTLKSLVFLLKSPGSSSLQCKDNARILDTCCSSQTCCLKFQIIQTFYIFVAVLFFNNKLCNLSIIDCKLCNYVNDVM